jgi:hypothetical protein
MLDRSTFTLLLWLEGFRQTVCNHIVGRDVKHLDVTVFNEFSDGVVSNPNVFASEVVDWI